MTAVRSLAAVALASTVAPALAADVLVVDSGGAGDHVTIQAAVDAAADGDVVLVEGGVYAGFRVSDKSVAIVAEAGQQVSLTSGVLVEDLAFPRTVTLIRLQVQGEPNPAGADDDSSHGLVARNNLGAVRALACSFSGSTGDPTPCDPYLYDCLLGPYYYGSFPYYLSVEPHTDGWDGVRLENCLQVSFAGCVVRGGIGLEGEEYYGYGGNGGLGVRADGAAVTFYNCVLEGADGVYGGFLGGDGGDGLRVESNQAFASGTLFRGGDGGHADDFFVAYGGDGGDGVEVQAEGEVRLLAPTFEPGELGLSVLFPQFNGDAGVDVSGAGGLVEYEVAPRGLQVPTPVPDNGPLSLTFLGQPGDLAFLLVSASPSYLPIPGFSGVALVGNGPLKFLGIVGAGGNKVVNLTLTNVLLPGQEAVEVYLQSLFVDASANVVLGSHNHLVVLDPSF